MADVNVSKKYLGEGSAEEPLSEELLAKGKAHAKNLLFRMNDRQFVEWLATRFPEAFTGQVNIGVVTPGNVLFRFNYTDVADVIREELVDRMALPRVTKNMLAVPLINVLGARATSLEFMQSALDLYKETMKDGPEEPPMYVHDDTIGEVITKEWIDWYTDLYGVTRNAAWKVAAAKIAKDYGKDLKEHTAVPDATNPLVVRFVKSIDQIQI